MISETIHVAYADILELGDHVDFSDLDESLAQAAEKATAIDILGGYYSATRTIKLLKKVPRAKRAACKIRLAVGIDASAKIGQHWFDLRSLDQDLRRAGFRDITLAIVSGRRHFHTKLFHFLRATHHVWFVGSANPGSDRHELMVSFTGKHEALRDYIDAAFNIAQPVTRQFPPRQCPANLREFFLTGSLIHRAPQKALFTFDAFRLDQEDREKMMRALTSDVVPHARPKTQGFAFGLRSAVQASDLMEGEADDIARVQLKLFCVDTALGLWAPRFYVEQIRGQILFSQEAREAELRQLRERLSGDGVRGASAAFADYVGSMKRLLLSIGITPRPIEKRDAAFERFISSRQKLLGNEEGIKRLSRRLEIIDMPDIWNDAKAARTFENSFFADVAYRLPAKQRIIRAIMRGLSLSEQAYLEADELGERFARRLRRQAWKDSEWAVE